MGLILRNIRANWNRTIGCTLVVASVALGSRAFAQQSVPFEVPAWAFPLHAPASPAVGDSATAPHVPGSRVTVTRAQLDDLFDATDWFPETHPVMPDVVVHGRRPAVIACGYCHLPDGAGRPENAMLAGLPAAYIARQVADMQSRARQSAWRGPAGALTPSVRMAMIADSVSPGEVEVAARYFSSLHPRQRARVVETRDVPRTNPVFGLYFLAPQGGTERLGPRLIEVPVEAWRHEMRDPSVEYVAYVPPGSIARGRALATAGVRDGPAPCVACHGPQLRGTELAPPLAGRSPSYILRQLLAFKTGSRAAPAGAPMRDVAARLGTSDMIAAAAYAGSLTP